MNNHLGGVYYKDKISNIVKQHITSKRSVLEICAGCGIIGKTLLEQNLVQNITFSDIQDLSHIHDNFIQSDGLSNITEQYDLIICSPPWYNSIKAPTKFLSNIDPIYWQDLNWKFHTNLYQNISNHLNPNGSLLITNCFEARSPESWKKMSNLTLEHTFINESHILPNGDNYPRNYILWWRLYQSNYRLPPAL